MESSTGVSTPANGLFSDATASELLARLSLLSADEAVASLEQPLPGDDPLCFALDVTMSSANDSGNAFLEVWARSSSLRAALRRRVAATVHSSCACDGSAPLSFGLGLLVALAGDSTSLQVLLAADAEMRLRRTAAGWSLLTSAIVSLASGALDCVRLLLAAETNAGESLVRAAPQAMAPLHVCARWARAEAFSELVRHASCSCDAAALADCLCCKAHDDGMSIATRAARAGSLGILDTLLTLARDAAALANSPDGRGVSAFQYACTYGHADCAKLLLQRAGISRYRLVHSKAACGCSPLVSAARGGRDDIVQLLMAQQPCENDCRRAAIVAAACGHTRVLEELLKCPCAPPLGELLLAASRHGKLLTTRLLSERAYAAAEPLPEQLLAVCISRPCSTTAPVLAYCMLAGASLACVASSEARSHLDNREHEEVVQMLIARSPMYTFDWSPEAHRFLPPNVRASVRTLFLLAKTARGSPLLAQLPNELLHALARAITTPYVTVPPV